MSSRHYYIDGERYTMPEVFYDIEYQDISAAAYAPSTAKYLRNGFLVRGDTEGTLPVITFGAYKANGDSTSGLSYVNMYVNANEWLMTPVVAVNTGGSSSNINVGLFN
jgi:hypothetical protein